MSDETKLIGDDFDVLDANAAEEDILSMIRNRVADLLDRDPELLFSYLYRLDVLEKDIKNLLQNTELTDVYSAFAKLIWERQKARIKTKKEFKQSPIEGWENFE